MVFLASTMVCKANYNFDDYIYPFGSRSYYSKNSNGKITIRTQFSFESQYYDNYLVEEIYIGMGVKSATNFYRYHTKGNAVVSDVQIYRNVLTGSTKYQNNIVIFAFPIDDKPYKWTEIDRGDTRQCTSEYVYIMASGKYLKAIKITRDNTFTVGKEKHREIEKSYWLKGYGRIITLRDLDGTEIISSQLDTYSTNLFEDISEISEEKYNAHMEYLKKQKEMEAFKEAIKPQSFQQKYPIYYRDVLNIIDTLAYTLDTVGFGNTFKITISSNSDINIQDNIFSSSPRIDKSIKEYLTKLLEEKKIILDTATNPETKQVVEVPLIFEKSAYQRSPHLLVQRFDLAYIKKQWIVAGQPSFSEELIKAAEDYRSKNKKAKNLRISARVLFYNDKSYFKGIKSIEVVRKK